MTPRRLSRAGGKTPPGPWSSSAGPPARSLLLQLGFNRRGDLLRLDLRLEAADDLAALADEELGEVPLDVAGVLRVGFLRGQVLVQWGDALAFDHHLGQ